MSSCNREVGRAPHASARGNVLGPKYRIGDLQPTGAVAISCLDEGLSNIVVEVLNNTVRVQVVAANANVVDMVLVSEVLEDANKRGAVVGHYLTNCASVT